MVPVIIADRLRYLWQQHRAGTLRRVPVTVLSQILLPIALAPLGIFAFMAYLRWHMGDGLAFIHVQSALEPARPAALALPVGRAGQR